MGLAAVGRGSQRLVGGAPSSRVSLSRLNRLKLPSRPPGADWVHEIKHDGYRLIVRRDGPVVRLHSRNAIDWTVKLRAIVLLPGGPRASRRLFVSQVEYCDNLIFRRRAALDILGERLLDANRTIGRPDKITVIFGRKITKHYRGKLQTEIEDMNLPNPVDPQPLWKRLYQAICARSPHPAHRTGEQQRQRLRRQQSSAKPSRPPQEYLNVQQDILETFVDCGSCENLLNQQSPLPGSVSRASSSIILASLPSCMHWCASHTSLPATPSLRPKSSPPSSKRSAAPPSTARSLRSATTSRKSAPRVLLPSSPTLAVINCSRKGCSICLVFLKLFERVYAPLTAGLLRPIKADARLQTERRSQLDRLYQRGVDDLDTLVRAVGLKAA
jgi:hypothetical protein